MSSFVSTPVSGSDREAIATWIRERLSLPCFADGYIGALEQIKLRAPGFVRFGSHVARDIMNGLVREHLRESSQQVQYVQRVGDIASIWNPQWGAETLTSAEPSADPITEHRIPVECCRRIARLLAEHQEGVGRNETTNLRFFVTFLNYSGGGSIPTDLVEKWREARSWFQKNAHFARDRDDAAAAPAFLTHFGLMEQVLLAAARTTTHSLDQLNDILEETNR